MTVRVWNGFQRNSRKEARLRLMIGEITRFSNAKRLASYFGLAPRVHQSADTERHRHITKEGNRTVRGLVIQAALVHTRTNPGGERNANTGSTAGTNAGVDPADSISHENCWLLVGLPVRKTNSPLLQMPLQSCRPQLAVRLRQPGRVGGAARAWVF